MKNDQGQTTFLPVSQRLRCLRETLHERLLSDAFDDGSARLVLAALDRLAGESAKAEAISSAYRRFILRVVDMPPGELPAPILMAAETLVDEVDRIETVAIRRDAAARAAPGGNNVISLAVGRAKRSRSAAGPQPRNPGGPAA